MCTTNRSTTLDNKKRRLGVSIMDSVAPKSMKFVPKVSFNMPQTQVNVQQESRPVKKSMVTINVQKADMSGKLSGMLPGAEALKALSQQMQNYAKALALIKTHEDHNKALENKNKDLIMENRELRDLLVDTMLSKNKRNRTPGGGQLEAVAEVSEQGVVKESNPKMGAQVGVNLRDVSETPTPTNLPGKHDMAMPTPATRIHKAAKTSGPNKEVEAFTLSVTPLTKTVLRPKRIISCPTAPMTGFASKSRLIKGGHKSSRLDSNFMLNNEPEIFT